MNLNSLMDSVLSIVQTIGIADILDVLIVTVLLYNVLNLFKQSNAFKLLKSIMLFFVVYILATQLSFKTLSFLLTNLLQFGFFALLVVFQPELRRAFEQIGRTNVFSLSFLKRKTEEEIEIDRLKKAIVAICDGAQRMSEKEIGALMVLEKFSSLGDIKRTGTPINAEITPELIGTIFYNGSPLHDGAAIITDAKISAAGCVLPLSDNLDISKEMGTRHRAALGLSENSDALILVVSEETGVMSIAKNGVLLRNLDRHTLYSMLDKEFVQPIIESTERSTQTPLFRRKSNE